VSRLVVTPFLSKLPAWRGVVARPGTKRAATGSPAVAASLLHRAGAVAAR